MKKSVFYIFLFLGLYSCSSTKLVPEGEYLLDKMAIVMDDKGADETLLMSYIQQKPNTSKGAVRLYGLVKNDSNAMKRFIRKMGEAPVLFRESSVVLSVRELETEMRNLGYLHAKVSAQTDTAAKKASVIYRIHNGEPYRIRQYDLDVPQLQRRNRASNRTDSVIRPRQDRRLIKEGSIFNLEMLDKERKRVATQLRNRGYYTFSENRLHYWADTALRSNQVDLRLALADTSAFDRPYKVERVNVFSGFDPLEKSGYQITDSMEYNGVHIYYDRMRFLRPRMIAEKVQVRPQQLFRERAGENTYNLFQKLDCVGRVDVQYVENNYSDSTLLDCNLYLTPGNNHSVQITGEGTNKAGDLGLAVDVNYGNLNLFNGSEQFNIRFRGAYEWVAGQSGDAVDEALNHNYYELGVSPSLTFSTFHLPWLGAYLSENFHTQTQYGLEFNVQRRPEYIRNFLNFHWQFNWTSQRQSFSQSLNLLDINYVNMPWKSGLFQHYLDEVVDPLTKLSYADVFTAGINYNLIFSNAETGRVRSRLYTFRLHFETSGNVLYGISKLFDAPLPASGQYNILGNPFAQYLKGELDWAETFYLTPAASLAFHAGLGLAVPYLNSSILPFEKRYFAGGPNSVRGWRTRYLGPGSFQGNSGDPTTHVGDMNLILNLEYRHKIFSWLEPAVFVDAGNIWTVKDYPNQPGGLFRWNQFYKEMAVGAGVGLRLDLSFLILRLDAGTRVYDPTAAEKRFVLFHGNFWKQSAVYLAIGYPF
ncbi:membrane protein [Bacteroidia bacterium]|nr:membrane protein [Bacteroidia bacterium]